MLLLKTDFNREDFSMSQARLVHSDGKPDGLAATEAYGAKTGFIEIVCPSLPPQRLD